MLGFDGSELLLIVVVAVVVMKPEDLPKAMLTAGRLMRRFNYVKFALSRQFDELMQESDLEELRKANFTRAQHLPDIDESGGDLEDYHESQTRPKPAEPAEHENPVKPEPSPKDEEGQA